MEVQRLIADRRDAKRHTEADLRWLCAAAAEGSVPDYQLSAWLMAAYLNPLDDDETLWLTRGIAESGTKLDLTGLPKPWLDKHSTGGVGDKTTIVLMPILAACGVTMIKMSGRGLGITGGTVDKLATIPGFRLDLSPEELKSQAKKIGIAISGRTPNLAPADKVLYALRDSTCTVESIPLIVASILGKKIAGGAMTIVLDVKCGNGAFMPDFKSATKLANALKRTGEGCGLTVKIAITDMDRPLGAAVGNLIEVQEAIRTLFGGGNARFMALCLDLSAICLKAASVVGTVAVGRERAINAIESGAAAAKADQWIRAQGSTLDLDGILALPLAPETVVCRASAKGCIEAIDAAEIGRSVIDLGGGRHRVEDEIDGSVGVELHAEVGQVVVRHTPLFTVHARTRAEATSAAFRCQHAFRFGGMALAKNTILKTL